MQKVGETLLAYVAMHCVRRIQHGYSTRGTQLTSCPPIPEGILHLSSASRANLRLVSNKENKLLIAFEFLIQLLVIRVI